LQQRVNKDKLQKFYDFELQEKLMEKNPYGQNRDIRKNVMVQDTIVV